MKNWRTTVAGVVFAIGTALVSSEEPLLRQIGSTMVAASGLLGFFFAKDKSVTGVGSNARTESELY
jgi:hypothetical protein